MRPSGRRGKWSLDGVHLWNERGSGEPIQRRREGYDTASGTLDVWCSGICHPMSWLAVTFTTQEINSLIRWLVFVISNVVGLQAWR